MNEYEAVNGLSENSYYYTESRKTKDIDSINIDRTLTSIEENEVEEIRVLNSNSYTPIVCTVFF